MATAEQLKALVSSFGDRDDARFYRVALQLAASEARKGHRNVARELRELIDEARAKPTVADRAKSAVPIAKPRGDLEGVLTASFPDTRLSHMVLSDKVRQTLERLLSI